MPNILQESEIDSDDEEFIKKNAAKKKKAMENNLKED
jgi:hypothetical protein